MENDYSNNLQKLQCSQWDPAFGAHHDGMLYSYKLSRNFSFTQYRIKNINSIAKT